MLSPEKLECRTRRTSLALLLAVVSAILSADQGAKRRMWKEQSTTRLALLLVVLCGLLLRLYGINFGLPYVYPFYVATFVKPL